MTSRLRLWNSNRYEAAGKLAQAMATFRRPRSLGRVVAIALMHLTTLLVMPLLTAEIAAKLIVNCDAFTHDEQEEVKLTFRRLGAKVDALTVAPCEATTTTPTPGGACKGC